MRTTSRTVSGVDWHLLAKYFDFEGEARRSEYWWFILFVVVVGFVLAAFSRVLSGLFSLLTIIPAISAATRRL